MNSLQKVNQEEEKVDQWLPAAGKKRRVGINHYLVWGFILMEKFWN